MTVLLAGPDLYLTPRLVSEFPEGFGQMSVLMIDRCNVRYGSKADIRVAAINVR
jgi:hypothetical protein